MEYKIKIDTKTFLRFWLVLIGLAVAGLLIYKAKEGLIIIGAALFLAIAISPLVNKLAGIFPSRGRKIPIALAYSIVVAGIVGFLAIVVPTITSESIRFVANLPSTMSNSSFSLDTIDEIGNRIGIPDLQSQIMQSIGEFSTEFVKDFGTHITSSISALGDIITSFILIIVLGMLMLIEGPGIFAQFWSNFRTNPQAVKSKKVLARMGDVISKYVSSNLIVCIINACATAICVFVLSLFFDFSAGLALPFGLITGVLGVIPMFGSPIGTILVSILLAFNAWPAGIIFAAYDTIYLQFESNWIMPKIQSKSLQLPALVVLASVTIGVYMFGLIGTIIATPIAGCLKIILEEYGDGFLPIEHKAPKRQYLRKKIANTDKTTA